jgi:uncharacterized phage infection (PIP) family protein YhgE
MKDIRSLLLILLSFGLVATWVYHFYDKATYSHPKTEITSTDSTAVADGVRDSLRKVYSATISNLDLRLDSTRNTSDSLQTQLIIKVKEVNKLKTEISSILKNPKSTNSELSLARQKMKELEDIVEELRNEKNVLELERKELNARLDQMSGEVGNLQQNIRRLDDENKNLAEKIKLASVFVASTLHFTAIDEREVKEQETLQAKKADKFVASFVLQNNFNEYMNAEIMIVIIEPDGHVLQSSTWDSGSFDTRTEGRKSYTRKMRFDYTKGEQKALIFTLDVDTFQKGTYTLQIWHTGMRIGEITKTLN